MNKRLAAILVIASATIAVYLPVSGFQFVNYDDPIYVSNNPRAAEGLNAAGLRWALTSTEGANWFPVTRLSHLTDVSLHGLDAGGHHTTNLLIHIANTVVLLLLLNSLTGAFWRSAMVAALFALHPVHVETVAWVSERKGLLSTTFWLLSTAAYVAWVRRESAGFFALSAALLALGLMAKSMLVTLPLVFLLLDYWPLGRLQNARDARERVVEKWPLFAVVALSVIITLVAQRNAMGLGFDPAPLSLRLANAVSSSLRYLELAVWPVDLAVMHPHPYLEIAGGEPLGAARVVFASLAILVLSFLLLGFSTRPWARVGWLWYAVTLLPVIGLIQVGHQAYAERYAYVPLIGIYLVTAWGAERVAARGNAWRHATVSLVILSLIGLGISTRAQVGHWRDSIALFSHAIQVSPGSGVTHHNLAVALVAADRFEEALPHFERAVEIEPRNPRYLNNLGGSLQRMGKPLAAIPLHQRAVSIGPRNAVGNNLLGEAHEAAGQFDDAIRAYEAALKTRPGFDRAARNLERLKRQRSG